MEERPGKEEFIRLGKEHTEASKKFHDYLGQFFTTSLNGKIEKEATKVLTPQEIEIIQDLRKGVDEKWQELVDFMRRKV